MGICQSRSRVVTVHSPRYLQEHCQFRLCDDEASPDSCDTEASVDQMASFWQPGTEARGVLAIYDYKRGTLEPLRQLIALGEKVIKPEFVHVLREECFGCYSLPINEEKWPDYFELLRQFPLLEVDWPFLIKVAPHLAIPMAQEIGISIDNEPHEVSRA